MQIMPVIINETGRFWHEKAAGSFALQAIKNLRDYRLTEFVKWYLVIFAIPYVKPHIVRSENVPLSMTSGGPTTEDRLEKEIERHLTDKELRYGEGIDLVVTQANYLSLVVKIIKRTNYTPHILESPEQLWGINRQ